MSVSTALGTEAVITTLAGPIHLRDTGPAARPNGHTLVMNPGFLANGDLWRPVVPGLHAAGFRVISLDPPTGAHREPMHPDADLSPHGLANILGEVLDRLDAGQVGEAGDVTLVANDSGCAITQLLMLGDHPGAKRVGRVVFATGDFFEHYPPAPFRPLLALPKVPFAVHGMLKALRANAVWQAPTSFGWLTKAPLPAEIRASWLEPALASKGVRDDVAKVLLGIDNKLTIEAATRFHEFDRPVLFVWAADDKFFPPSDADKAAELFPDARVVKVADARTFVMWDQPEAVVAAIVTFHT